MLFRPIPGIYWAYIGLFPGYIGPVYCIGLFQGYIVLYRPIPWIYCAIKAYSKDILCYIGLFQGYIGPIQAYSRDILGLL